MYLALKLARITYDFVLLLIWPVLYFYYFCRSLTDGKYLTNYRARMGLCLPASFRNGPERVWIHALSIGEVLSSIPLLLEIKNQRPGLEIVFSTSTETGMALAKERLSDIVGTFFFMPHDFPWVMRVLIKRIRPVVFVLIETDAWPNLLHQLRKCGIFSALVNGRVSPDSYRRYLRLAGFAGMIFNEFNLIFTQTELDRARFESLGNLSGRVLAAGNLKFESSAVRVSESEVLRIRNEIDCEKGRPVWIAGSTHEGEEDIVLRVHRKLRSKIPDLLLMIAPRNVARRNELETLCTSMGLTFAVRSNSESASEKAVYLIDTFGELAKLYALSDIAFIGGSFVPAGGHNPLEPVALGKPVCWGPHFFNFHEIETTLLLAGCGVKVSSEVELEHVLKRFFDDAFEKDRMVQAAWSFAGFQQGTAERIASVLLGRISVSRRVALILD
jgi:3-deoxy-D-manno-octulosonic-acid transferase